MKHDIPLRRTERRSNYSTLCYVFTKAHRRKQLVRGTIKTRIQKRVQTDYIDRIVCCERRRKLFLQKVVGVHGQRAANHLPVGTGTVVSQVLKQQSKNKRKCSCWLLEFCVCIYIFYVVVACNCLYSTVLL